MITVHLNLAISLTLCFLVSGMILGNRTVRRGLPSFALLFLFYAIEYLGRELQLSASTGARFILGELVEFVCNAITNVCLLWTAIFFVQDARSANSTSSFHPFDLFERRFSEPLRAAFCRRSIRWTLMLSTLIPLICQCLLLSSYLRQDITHETYQSWRQTPDGFYSAFPLILFAYGASLNLSSLAASWGTLIAGGLYAMLHWIYALKALLPIQNPDSWLFGLAIPLKIVFFVGALAVVWNGFARGAATVRRFIESVGSGYVHLPANSDLDRLVDVIRRCVSEHLSAESKITLDIGFKLRSWGDISRI